MSTCYNPKWVHLIFARIAGIYVAMSKRTKHNPLGALTREEVADLLNVTTNTLEVQHRQGRAPPRLRFGRQWVYPLKEFLDWRAAALAAAEHAPTRQRRRIRTNRELNEAPPG
jgi:hypothetical protein